MKKILFVINDISMPGGLATVTRQLSLELKSRYKDEYEVAVVSGAVTYPDLLRGDDFINLGLPSLHTKSKLEKINWYIRFAFKLKKLIEKESQNKDLTVVGVATTMNLVLGLLAKKIQGKCKLIFTEHLSFEKHSRFVLKLREFCYKNSDVVVSLTKTDLDKYSHIGCNTVVIPNFVTIAGTDEYNDHIKNILCIGRFTKQKGFDLLIEGLPDFFNDFPDWTLTIVGEGPMEKEIKTRISDLGIENNIVFKSPTKNISQEYLASSIYALPSRYEGFPMVLLEAQAYSLPIVSFDCPTGPADIIIDTKTGFLTEYKNVEQFICKLKVLAGNPQLRKDFSVQAKVRSADFTADNILPLWKSIL